MYAVIIRRWNAFCDCLFFVLCRSLESSPCIRAVIHYQKYPHTTGPYTMDGSLDDSTMRRFIIAVFSKRSEIHASARDVFAWHQSPDALKKLIPPWEKVTVEQPPASLGDGALAVLVLHIGPMKLRWVARHRDFIDRGDEGGEFTDEQVSGPFAAWIHRHIVRATGPASCVLEDRIDYAVPLGRLGDVLAGWHVRKKLGKMFDYRHGATISALQAARSNRDQ